MGITPNSVHFKPRMNILDQAGVARIHQATMEVLERTGVKMGHARGLEILHGAGCRVEKDRVYFPAWVVERALDQAPDRVVLGDRHGNRTVTLEGRNTYFGPSLDCLDYLEPSDNSRRPFTAADAGATAALAQKLECFDWTMIIGLASDQPTKIADRVVARQVLENCAKPLVFCCNDLAAEKAIHEMAVCIAGSKEKFAAAPTIVQYSEPISPLVYYDPAVDKIIYSAEESIPLINFPAPQCGGTAPMTLAGNIVQGSAESLSGLVLHQAVNPGAPFIYGAFSTIMDMRTTIFSYGAVELSLMCNSLAQMAQYYKLPFFGTGGCSDAKFNDPQAAIEATFQTLVSGAVGAGLVHDCSAWLDHGCLVSPAFMVMVNDILRQVHRFMQGVEISDETLAVDLINQVGPGGNYLQQPHTLKHFREALYSDLMDRSINDVWKKSGAKTFEERLRDKTLKLMAAENEPLPAEVLKELAAMQKNWEKGF